jgi:Spy/CpxP family protein refolding chaperone
MITDMKSNGLIKPENQEAKMKSKLIVFSAVLVLVLSAALFANDKDEGPGPGKCMKGRTGMMAGGPRMVLAMASELNLTADQMDRIKKIIDQMPKKDANKDEMKADRDAMKEEMKKDKPDQAKINALIDKMAEKKKEAMKIVVKCMEDVNAVLTPEQKEILKKKMEEKKKKYEDNGGKKGK